MEPIDIHFRRLIVFEGSIIRGKQLYQGICWHDGERLELEQEDGTKVDITHLQDFVDRPLTGSWADKFPDADCYVEVPKTIEENDSCEE